MTPIAAVIFDLGGVVLGSPLHAIAAYERDRQIVYDFINRRYLLRDDITGQIVEGDWTYQPDVRKEYFAYSNSRASRKLYRKARRVDKRLTDPGAWV